MTAATLNMSLFAAIQVFVFIAMLRVVYKSGVRITSSEEYLYAHAGHSSGLNKKATWKTAVASNFQAANVLFINTFMGFYYGLTMIWLPITFCLGILLISYLCRKKSAVDIATLFENDTPPYDRLIPSGTNIISFAIYGSIIISAVLEIWFGTKMASDVASPLFQPFFGNTSDAQLEVFAIVGTMISVLLFFYIYIGGYRAVASTDGVQLKLIFTMLAIMFLGVVAGLHRNGLNFDISMFLSGQYNYSTDPFGFWAIMIGAFFLNAFWQIVSPQQWQRAKAAKNGHEYLLSINQTTFGTFISWVIPVIVGAISSGIVSGTVLSAPAAFPFLTLYNVIYGESQASLFIQVIATIMLSISVAGIFAAALSSADTAIIAVLARLVRHHNINDLDDIRRRGVASVLVICAITVLLNIWSPDIKNVIFAVSTAQIFFAPIFIRFIAANGKSAVKSGMASHLVTAIFCIFVILATALNMVPSVSRLLPNFNFLLPLFAFMVGVWFAINDGFFLGKEGGVER